MNNNKLIAEFMGLPTEVSKAGLLNYYHREFSYKSGTWYEEHELSYNVSWDWLMPVVNEIIKSRDEQNADWDLTDLKYGLQSTNIDMLYKAVIEFIKTYEDNQIIYNGLIAEFMGLEEHKGSYYIKDEWIYNVDLEYDESWDWLMPVVEKIESLRDVNGNAYRFTIDMCNAQIEGTHIEIIGGAYKLNTTYKAVIEFIESYDKE